MSHVISTSTFLIPADGLVDLEQACLACGMELKHGQKTHKWYGRWVNDYHGDDAAYKSLILDPNDYGKCEHAIGVPGNKAAYEIGLVRVRVEVRDGRQVAIADPKGTHYAPVYDTWDAGGKAIEDKAGKALTELAYQYGSRCIRRIAAAKRMVVRERVLENGTRQLVAVAR